MPLKALKQSNKEANDISSILLKFSLWVPSNSCNVKYCLVSLVRVRDVLLLLQILDTVLSPNCLKSCLQLPFFVIFWVGIFNQL